MSHDSLLFTLLLLLALGVFAWSSYRQLRLVGLGRPNLAFRGVAAGFREMLVYAFLQRRVVRQPFGFNHLVFSWGFLVLLAANLEFMVSGVAPALRWSLLPDGLYLPLRFTSDLLVALTLVAVALALVRRTIAPPYPEGRNLEAYTILVLIGVHMLAYLGVAGTEIAMGEERAAAAMPFSRLVAGWFACGGACGACTVAGWWRFFWWLHAGALLAFVAVLIPFTKHLHIITAIVNCFLHRPERPNTQEPEQFAAGGVYGAGQVDRLGQRDLLDSFACTKCGRCQVACPATTTGKPLNPREVVQAVRRNLLANGTLLQQGKTPLVPLIGDGETASVSEAAIWSCTSCGACMESCPVFIEHLPKLVQLRRHLVEMEARFPEELLNLFENTEGRSNPWGIAPSERGKWASQLGERPYVPGETEYLFYVGCAGSFDSRQKQVSLAVAMLLDAAGVSWGILGREELCCGDSLRRLGNEFVFDRLARQNVALFQERQVRKVVTTCPHCFSTLGNDYRQYGLEVEVVHHSQLLAQLLADGRLSLPDDVTDRFGKVVLHDSCYLGRHNGVYDEPRRVVAQATGTPPAEFPRHGGDSFCCGAGGGRMWMEEQLGSRINLNRVEEALRLNPDTICVGCPYCMTMLEDGLKDKGAGQTRVRDLAELLAERALLPS